MEKLAVKRIVKDMEILKKNKDELQSRGIYYHIDEENIRVLHILIVPKEKQEGDLVSPYTYGFFMFQIIFGGEFPLSPPNVSFYPQQDYCRLHPNYYKMGKVCLSVINTWSNNDWTPSTSIMSLINILEERLNENGICFEPGLERSSVEKKKAFNTAIEYAKYKVCILDVLEHPLFRRFKTVMIDEMKANMGYLTRRLEELRELYGNGYVAVTPCYGDRIICDYDNMLTHMKKISSFF